MRYFLTLSLILLHGLLTSVPPLFLLAKYDLDVALYTFSFLINWTASNFIANIISALSVALIPRRWWLITTIVLTLITATLCILYALSILEQGDGFNALFWDYFRVNILWATHAYTILFALYIVWLILLSSTLFLIYLSAPRITFPTFNRWLTYLPQKNITLPTLSAVFFICIFASLPTLEFFNDIFFGIRNTAERLNRVQARQLIQHPAIQARLDLEPRPFLAGAHPKWNLVWIYLESFERTYFETPQHIAELDAIRQHSVEFTNIEQLQPIAGTGIGVFASQCAFLYSGASGNTQLCFMQTLQRQHYKTVHLQAAVKYYHRQRPNGYDLFWGRDEISPYVKPEYRNLFWGIYDEGLLTFAQSFLQRLSVQKRPFALTIATIDNHTPSGLISPSCETSIPHFTQLSNFTRAAACTSWTVSRLIRFIRAQPNSENTLIVVTSDHLHPQHNWGNKKRRLTFFINYPDGRHGKMNAHGTHFDIGPTVLEAMGFKNTDMGLGQSLISHQKGFLPSITTPEQINLVRYIKPRALRDI